LCRGLKDPHQHLIVSRLQGGLKDKKSKSEKPKSTRQVKRKKIDENESDDEDEIDVAKALLSMFDQKESGPSSTSTAEPQKPDVVLPESSTTIITPQNAIIPMKVSEMAVAAQPSGEVSLATIVHLGEVKVQQDASIVAEVESTQDQHGVNEDLQVQEETVALSNAAEPEIAVTVEEINPHSPSSDEPEENQLDEDELTSSPNKMNADISIASLKAKTTSTEDVTSKKKKKAKQSGPMRWAREVFGFPVICFC
jgi:hypothetical protein